MVRPCFVCGFESRAAICPRCNTILRAERAVCRTCGRAFDGWIANCDACGGLTVGEPKGPSDREAVKTLSSVPGISESRAKELVAKGFRDFADVIRLALPESAVRVGLHHTIARKALLLDLVTRQEPHESGAQCPMCGAAWLVYATRCPACGSSFDLALDPVVMEQKLQEITGEIVDLAMDEDFQGMPESVRDELLQAFGGVSPEDLLREEYEHQVEAWRRKGFDVTSVELVLAEDLPHFRERTPQLIRAQVMKKAESGKYRCPLCEVAVDRMAEECGNCGARFA
ncbi:MAG: hypothetical protein E6K15_09155 [Methanobacteriota archaeon]|nr:MAG: hypothetical protein E6K15_09155 [Euryarchaeota archaeon]